MILRSIFTRVTNIWQSILTSLIVGGGKACATTTRPMIWLGTVLPWDSDTRSRSRPVMWITCHRTESTGHGQIYIWDVTEFLLRNAKLHLAHPTSSCIFCNHNGCDSALSVLKASGKREILYSGHFSRQYYYYAILWLFFRTLFFVFVFVFTFRGSS